MLKLKFIMNVCILGSGLTSLSLAKTLINQGLGVDLFSDNTKNIYSESQTIGISKSNVKFFNSNILNIDKLLWGVKKINVYSENFKNEAILNFENNKNDIFSIIKNKQLYDHLFQRLKKNKSFNIKKKKFFRYQDYELVINCDPNHLITKKFFYKSLKKNYNSFGHVTIIKHESFKNDTATQIFTKDGPIAFLPISNTETSIVFSARGISKISKEELKRIIKRFSKKYKIFKIDNIRSFDLKSSNLRTYFYKNILAFGDLLHRLHPHAGQGFNMITRDIKVLSELISFRNSVGIQIDSSIIPIFEQKTKSKNYLFSNGIDFIYEFFNIESKTQSKFMSKSVQILGKNKILKKTFMRLADDGIVI